MDQILNSFERKFGNWAIPGLIRYLAIIFFGTFLMAAAKPEIIAVLDFDFEKIKAGEYWRLFSFILAPEGLAFGARSAICAFFGTLLLFTFGDALENEWGVFRTNLYVLGGYLSILITNLILSIIIGFSVPFSGFFLASSIFFAFATYFPHYKINIFFVFPCPVWLLAVVDALFLLRIVIFFPYAAPYMILCLANYFVVVICAKFLPSKASLSRSRRKQRARFKSYSRERTPFHSCSACGANDVTHPEKEFRVSQDGNDYCLEHLPK